ncbi:MAG: inositol monophosphatase family protein, partial [Streptomycetales bacterium]
MNLDDHELAGHLASHAGARLLEIRERHGFADPAALRSAGDRTSHEVLVAELAKRCPDDAVLSEEGAADPRRRTAERVWIVDPLDGTREFGEAGRDDWAVHVALWQQGELVAGAVAMPARDLTLTTASP